MDRDEKKKSAEELHEELKKARGIILSGFQGITVAQDFDLRRKIAGTGARYKVVKNSLIERAAKGTPVEPIAKSWRERPPWHLPKPTPWHWQRR